jgi:hypothetical protein
MDVGNNFFILSHLLANSESEKLFICHLSVSLSVVREMEHMLHFDQIPLKSLFLTHRP